MLGLLENKPETRHILNMPKQKKKPTKEIELVNAEMTTVKDILLRVVDILAIVQDH